MSDDGITEMEYAHTELFHFDDDCVSFDDLARQNGFRYWFARDFMKMLGYVQWSTFNKAIQKAMSTCASLGIDIPENFVKESRTIDGKIVDDWKVSKFACYLIAMNGDSKKPRVAQAQVYFATMAEAYQRHVQEAEAVERILIRDEITEHEKGLSSVANQAGIENYGFFRNKGYLGLYNMPLKSLKARKGIPDKKTPLDFMGKEELAANLFRITQTEAKIRNENVQGQKPLENAAYVVGKKVRKAMLDLSGTAPEDLPPSHDIKTVKSDLKKTQKEFLKEDKLKQIE
ncbi:MAG: BRO family protein [Terasakiella sp.]|uniref:BRO family protein n=1 Tax=unclassified Terasakiella TaxID=2614952 RepID=UPI003AFF970F